MRVAILNWAVSISDLESRNAPTSTVSCYPKISNQRPRGSRVCTSVGKLESDDEALLFSFLFVLYFSPIPVVSFIIIIIIIIVDYSFQFSETLEWISNSDCTRASL